MNNRLRHLIFLLLMVAGITTVRAQEDNTPGIVQSSKFGWFYSLKAGFNIGGTAPLPLPREIRSIDSYSPSMGIAIEGSATKWFDANRHWGLSVGLRLENKGMTTQATVKNYGMKIINADNGKYLEGLWTGGVKTKVRGSYLTLPVLANYKISQRWKLVAGPYISYLLEGDFSGHVYEGHLRTPDQTGSRVDFTNGSIATYDFSSDLRRFLWGVQLGGEWQAFKHLSVHADLTWGLNDIFQCDFKTITFAMYPIYLNLGFGYSF
ncbi:MAG: PorT family protein [Prevotellaceae bacterium]|jgi:hypothetical protein|nr:PorT family protein [Prevotellaceae bacterium]